MMNAKWVVKVYLEMTGLQSWDETCLKMRMAWGMAFRGFRWMGRVKWRSTATGLPSWRGHPTDSDLFTIKNNGTADTPHLGQLGLVDLTRQEHSVPSLRGPPPNRDPDPGSVRGRRADDRQRHSLGQLGRSPRERRAPREPHERSQRAPHRCPVCAGLRTHWMTRTNYLMVSGSRFYQRPSSRASRHQWVCGAVRFSQSNPGINVMKL